MSIHSNLINYKGAKGFSLIELMIVVAIIGILAAVGLPAYQNYTIRAQVSEGLLLSGDLKITIAEYYGNHGHWPADNLALDLDLSSSGSYVSSIASTSGQIVITYGNRAHQKLQAAGSNILALTPAVRTLIDGSAIVTWICGYSPAPGSAVLAGTDITTVNTTYLPIACKK